MPYLGRSVRIAHLRIIKQRGFTADDYDVGMKYFELAMAELGAPEVGGQGCVECWIVRSFLVESG